VKAATAGRAVKDAAIVADAAIVIAGAATGIADLVVMAADAAAIVIAVPEAKDAATADLAGSARAATTRVQLPNSLLRS
jgi:D-arabinose 1-dehydrogenase-like Zn-dependent alcohol dehydrogenase